MSNEDETWRGWTRAGWAGPGDARIGNAGATGRDETCPGWDSLGKARQRRRDETRHGVEGTDVARKDKTRQCRQDAARNGATGRCRASRGNAGKDSTPRTAHFHETTGYEIKMLKKTSEEQMNGG